MSDPDPLSVARQMVMGFRTTHLLAAMAELGIADRLADGPRTSDELANRLGVNRDALFRVLRALGQIGVLAHGADGTFALTPVGECFRSDHPKSLRAVARFWGHEMMQRAWGNLVYSIKTGEPAFDHVYGMPAFDYLNTDAEAAAVYNAGMAQRASASTSSVVNAYNFSGFSLIVDVGAGNGSLLAGILESTPKPRGIAFDLPHARDDAENVLRHAGLEGRARFEAGDFFQSVPSGGDCYLLRQIVHDWADEPAVAILRSCRKAIPDHGKLLLIEIVLPPAGEPALELVMLDIAMLVRVGGRERTVEEYRALLAQAGFRLERVIPTQGMHSILECVPSET